MDYFKSWRRKIGVLTLAVACVLMAGWVRSYLPNNGFYFFGHWLDSSRPGIIESTLKHINIAMDGTMTVNRTALWSVAYWPLVIPLTLLSAWLLLSKPRPAKQIEPTAS